MEKFKLKSSEWDEMATMIAKRLKELEKPAKRFMKSAETRQMLGGISAAKLQSLRIGGLPAVDADGLWLYEYDDVVNFTERNKSGGEEATRR
jgi:hypothetical protein